MSAYICEYVDPEPDDEAYFARWDAELEREAERRRRFDYTMAVELVPEALSTDREPDVDIEDLDRDLTLF